MTESQVLEIIQKITLNHKNKSFSYFDEEDICQEIAIICLQAIDKFDVNKVKADNIPQALENFLNRVTSTRLKNLFRDNYGIRQRKLKNDTDHNHETKKLLNNPIYFSILENVDIPKEYPIDEQSFYHRIILHLNVYELETLDCLLSGVKVSSYYKLKLFERIKDLLKNENSWDQA